MFQHRPSYVKPTVVLWFGLVIFGVHKLCTQDRQDRKLFPVPCIYWFVTIAIGIGLIVESAIRKETGILITMVFTMFFWACQLPVLISFG